MSCLVWLNIAYMHISHLTFRSTGGPAAFLSIHFGRSVARSNRSLARPAMFVQSFNSQRAVREPLSIRRTQQYRIDKQKLRRFGVGAIIRVFGESDDVALAHRLVNQKGFLLNQRQ